jgi:hypothetical protein
MGLTRCRVAHGDQRDRRCAWCGGELPARHRRWCSDACQDEWWINHVWRHARVAALERAGHRCQAATCAETEDLEVHHRVPVEPRTGYAMGCQHHQENLEVLCPGHHRERHALLRAPAGTVTQLKLVA